ncbi:tyrosine-type recombinase/integrase [Neiella marina]|uniref:Tyrosine-type recombinase/integrase n=1 Tax=Neiella holothuriorum TaxID=2870530 RepID=A0ABS7EE88_9GAMM|nr:tyrosine-type recombinase/integrase [Neiella holothuriorum]MBW8190659.1 tyrosine-type recombinase/integrase [Neiella holothuriorum]
MRYEEESDQYNRQLVFVQDLVEEYFASPRYQTLAAQTQEDYKKHSKNVLKVFSNMRVNSVRASHVRRYMDKRGLKSETQANREKSFLSVVFNWAVERDYAKANPTRGVKKFKEQARDKYVSGEEYQAVYDHAPRAVRVAMELAYLCASRQSDILSMAWDQVIDAGIYIEQSKTHVRQIKAWSPRLREAIDLAKSLSDAPTKYVLAKSNGGGYTKNGFNAAWQKAKRKARKASGLAIDFTFHDLKAKGISDFEGTRSEKQNFSGHKTERQVASYDRKVKVVPTVGSEPHHKSYSESNSEKR